MRSRRIAERLTHPVARLPNGRHTYRPERHLSALPSGLYHTPRGSKLHYLSIFSGIEAASAAWKPLGWKCVGFAEIESFPCKVLVHHYPDVPNLGDVTKITEADIMCLGNIDIIIFGSPCQDLSVAGKRKGLAGERSGLFHTAIKIIKWARIHCGLRWALWENVPGAFTSNSGRDFAAVVESLAGVEVAVPPKGWGTEGCAIGEKGMVEWAVLDAQWFGVAQRRRRVFALADFGDWSRRPPVLLEPESVRGDSAPSRSAGQSVAGTLTRGVGERGAEDGERGLLHVTHALTANGFDASEDGTGRGTPIVPSVSMCLNAGGMGRIDAESETLIPHAYMPARSFGADGGINEHFAERDVCDALHTASGSGNKALLIAFNYNAQACQLPRPERDTSVADSLTCSQGAAVAFSCKDYGADAVSDVAPTMRAKGVSEQQAVAFAQNQLGEIRVGEVANTINTNSNASGRNTPMVQTDMQVRRLTPRECERLQGFPDDWTALEKAADGPRYKALGNSMAVPVINWIGRSLRAASWDVWT